MPSPFWTAAFRRPNGKTLERRLAPIENVLESAESTLVEVFVAMREARKLDESGLSEAEAMA